MYFLRPRILVLECQRPWFRESVIFAFWLWDVSVFSRFFHRVTKGRDVDLVCWCCPEPRRTSANRPQKTRATLCAPISYVLVPRQGLKSYLYMYLYCIRIVFVPARKTKCVPFFSWVRAKNFIYDWMFLVFSLISIFFCRSLRIHFNFSNRPANRPAHFSLFSSYFFDFLVKKCPFFVRTAIGRNVSTTALQIYWGRNINIYIYKYNINPRV